MIQAHPKLIARPRFASMYPLDRISLPHVSGRYLFEEPSGELNNLAGQLEHVGNERELHEVLFVLLKPDQITQSAFDEQERRLRAIMHSKPAQESYGAGAPARPAAYINWQISIAGRSPCRALKQHATMARALFFLGRRLQIALQPPCHFPGRVIQLVCTEIFGPRVGGPHYVPCLPVHQE